MLRKSKHARERMLERDVTDEDVASVVSEHEVSFSDKKGNPCYVRTIGGRRIKVVVATDDPEL